jgi:hypothetical protein
MKPGEDATIFLEYFDTTKRVIHCAFLNLAAIHLKLLDVFNACFRDGLRSNGDWRLLQTTAWAIGLELAAELKPGEHGFAASAQWHDLQIPHARCRISAEHCHSSKGLRGALSSPFTRLSHASGGGVPGSNQLGMVSGLLDTNCLSQNPTGSPVKFLDVRVG